MSVIFTLIYLGIFLLIVFTPVWFAGSMIALLFSQRQREKVRAHWFLYTVLGFISFLVVGVTWVSYAPRHFTISAIEPFLNLPVTRETLANADGIVEGSFDTGHVVSTSAELLTGPYGPGFNANCFVVPFQVESSAKGDAAKTILVKICFPAQSRGGAMQWGMPLKEKLLLVLKSDPVQAGVYELVSQQLSWLVVVLPHAADVPAPDRAKFVVEDAKAFLAQCADHPGFAATIPYYTDIGGSILTGVVTARFPQSDPAREHALEMGKALAQDDPEFVALATKFQGEYGKVGELASSISANSGDTSYLESRMKEYNNQAPGTDAPVPGKFQIIGNNHYNFPWQVANTIQGVADLKKLMPVITSALASPDPRMREIVVAALRQRQYVSSQEGKRGNALGNELVPVLVKLLDDPDEKVQQGAMACIFYITPSCRLYLPKQEINLPAIWLFHQKHDFYIQQYKDWWEKHKAEYGTGP